MSRIQTTKFARKPFLIDAIQVNAENMADIAKWCGGEINHDLRGGVSVAHYILVPVASPRSERQKKAYVGDWVLFAGRTFKCYTDRAFKDSFEKPSGDALVGSLLGDCKGIGD